jgi:hypothetical protein
MSKIQSIQTVRSFSVPLDLRDKEVNMEFNEGIATSKEGPPSKNPHNQ